MTTRIITQRTIKRTEIASGYPSFFQFLETFRTKQAGTCLAFPKDIDREAQQFAQDHNLNVGKHDHYINIKPLDDGSYRFTVYES